MPRTHAQPALPMEIPPTDVWLRERAARPRRRGWAPRFPGPPPQPALPMEIPPTDVWLRERAARLQGHVLVAGVDEAGRGPLAGPGGAAAVLLPMGVEIPGINDSKLLPPEKRAELAISIRRVAVGIGVGQAEHDEI